MPYILMKSLFIIVLALYESEVNASVRLFTMIPSQELGSINCAAEKIAKLEEPRIRDILFEDAETLI